MDIWKTKKKHIKKSAHVIPFAQTHTSIYNQSGISIIWRNDGENRKGSVSCRWPSETRLLYIVHIYIYTIRQLTRVMVAIWLFERSMRLNEMGLNWKCIALWAMVYFDSHICVIEKFILTRLWLPENPTIPLILTYGLIWIGLFIECI